MPNPDRIFHVVAEYFGVDKELVRSEVRTRNIMVARHVGMHLMRELTYLSLESIGNFYGSRHHSTVLHACKKIKKMIETEGPIYQAVNLLTMKLKAEDGEELKTETLKHRG